MSEETDLEQQHKKFGVAFNNLVWELLGKPDRTAEEAEKMVHAAHASRIHWGEVGTAVNLARGDWMISHVYAVLNNGQMAFRYAKSSLHICEKNNIADFDLAYAYEAMARAFATAGDKEGYAKYIELAKAAGEKIQDEEDKKIFRSDLEAEPWYGMR